MKAKCKKIGCFEVADCKHGYCRKHCPHQHTKKSYSSRSYPRSSRAHIGVELEVEYDTNDAHLRGLAIANGYMDGSIGQYGVEYKILGVAEGMGADRATRQTRALVEEIWMRGGKATRRCGLHVHIDVRQISSDVVQAFLGWCCRTQDVWFSLMPASRRNNIYVAKLPSTGHYAWVHTTPYDTVEVRIHPSTVNPFKAEAWVHAMIWLQRRMAAGYQWPDTGDATADFWAVWEGAPAKAIEYLRARQAGCGVVRDASFASRDTAEVEAVA